MPKTKRSLKDIKIVSFVTSLNDDESLKVKGGETEGGPSLCNTRMTCNEKCGDTMYWECQLTDFCTWGTCTIPVCP